MNNLEIVKLFNRMIDNTRVISISTRVLYLEKDKLDN